MRRQVYLSLPHHYSFVPSYNGKIWKYSEAYEFFNLEKNISLTNCEIEIHQASHPGVWGVEHGFVSLNIRGDTSRSLCVNITVMTLQPFQDNNQIFAFQIQKNNGKYEIYHKNIHVEGYVGYDSHNDKLKIVREYDQKRIYNYIHL